MNLRPVEVLRWPATVDTAQNLLIIAIDTPDTPIRDTARQLVRATLCDILGDVELISLPGQPIRLARPDNAIGISISHETGQSLLAIHRSGRVGIDLLRIGGAHAWQAEILLLARNYLGPERAGALASLSSTAQVAEFGQAWTAHEARLKCLGMPLMEWSPALEAELSRCSVQQLGLPAGLVGSIATLKSGENRAF